MCAKRCQIEEYGVPDDQPATDSGPRNGRCLWITWERQRRNRELARHLDAKLVEIVIRGSRLHRYWRSAVLTIQEVIRERPNVLVVQSPSVLLALLATTLARRWCRTVVVDAHNAGIFPLEGRHSVLNYLCRAILASADAVIVSNSELRSYLALPHVYVLADPLFSDPVSDRRGSSAVTAECEDLHTLRKVVYVTSWASDEPVASVLDAAVLLASECEIRITGAPRLAGVGKGPLPNNVTLLGFLEESEYLAELRCADVVLVLTTRQSCLTCGAYEALSLGVPMILSNTTALRQYFGLAATYTFNESGDIADAVRDALGNTARLRHAAIVARSAIEVRWRCAFGEFRNHLLERQAS